MTRTAADAAVVLQAIAGHDPRDPSSSRRRVPAFARALRADLKGVRVGVPQNYYFDLVEPEAIDPRRNRNRPPTARDALDVLNPRADDR